MTTPRMWAVFDLDGTLANCDHPLPLIGEHGWDAFNDAHLLDEAHPAEVMIAQAWAIAGGAVAYITGRNGAYRTTTLMWLRRLRLPEGVLLMRETGDARDALTVKKQLIALLEGAHFADGDQLVFMMDDSTDVVDHFRSVGITVLQPRSART